MRRIFRRWAAPILTLYLVAYVVLRLTGTITWDSGRRNIIFPFDSAIAGGIFQPLMAIEGLTTGVFVKINRFP